MQTYLSYMDNLGEKIAKADVQAKEKLALDICKELYPDYESFSKKHGFGDPLKLHTIISFCEAALQSAPKDISGADRFKNFCDELAPDTEDFPDWDCSYALNAAASVSELLEYLKDGKDKHISEICSLRIDTTDFKIAEENEHISDDGIFKHPKMLLVMKEMMDKLS